MACPNEKTKITKSRLKQDEEALPKKTKGANQRNMMKEKKDIITMILRI